MDITSEWKINALLELEQAEVARDVGNEGRARVCARRAAGIIGKEYLRRNEIPHNSPSAYDVLRSLLSFQNVSPEAREITAHFLMRVDTGFSLPVDIDLLAEARSLASELLGETLS